MLQVDGSILEVFPRTSRPANRSISTSESNNSSETESNTATESEDEVIHDNHENNDVYIDPLQGAANDGNGKPT